MNLFRVAIVGAGTLKGKELKEALEERRFPAVDIKLLDDDESLGQLEAVADEATFIQSVRPEQFENVDFAFFASDEGFTRENWKLAKRAGCAIVDLSYGLEEQSEAAIRAPWIEQELRVDEQLDLEADAAVVAHPAAVVLALLMLRGQKLGVARTVATIFEPVSERGRRGMDELHEQTVSLLSFQEMTKKVFDVQVAFNTIARYGQQAHTQLEAVEARIVRHFQKVTRGRVAAPATVLVQAPIFHAHIFSIYIEVEPRASLGDLEQALQGEHVTLIRAGQEEGPSNVTAAGRDEVLLSVRRDPQHENGFWLWAAADNLRLSALTAVDCATALALTRSRGPVQ
jgi:aspartate-semialdehyde dehydrogenase